MSPPPDPIPNLTPRPRHQVSLTVTLTVSIGLLVLVAVGSVLWIGLSTTRRNTLDLLNVQSTMLVGEIESAIRNHLNPVFEQATFIADLVATGALDPADGERLSAVMLGTLAAAPQIMATVYWDPDLQKLIAFRDPGTGTGTLTGNDSQDPAVAAMIARVTAASGPQWGAPAFSRDAGETFVNLIAPLRRGDEFLGTLGTVVGMRELSFLMAEISLRLEATAFILYGDDQVLAHHHLTSANDELSETAPTVPLSRIGDLTLQRLAERKPIPGFANAAAAGVEVSAIESGGQTQIVFTKLIDGYSDRNWLIGAYLPLQQVNAELLRLRDAALAGLATLILAIVAAIGLARIIARPIRRVAAGANRVAALQLNDVQPIPGSYIREINEQASAFNAMLTGLRWFETYVPRRLVARLMASHGNETASDERDLTVMFTDIVGFTSLSETMSAGAIKELLNEHFTCLGAAIEAESGTIDKYIGDALMAFWGAPDHLPAHAAHACRAAQAIAAALAADNRHRRAQGKPPVRIRIGIHTGPAVVGNIGAPGRMNYTIVGDTVNTAQRLEGLGKRLPPDQSDTTILISQATASALDDNFSPVPIGEFELAGKREPLAVLQLST